MIKTGFCVSYDWRLLENSLPLIYDDSDTICLSLDKNRLTWSGLPFTLDYSEFNSLIKKIDHKNKVEVYQDDFFRPELSPRENGNRQRNMMAQYLGSGGWHVQIDADEYFIDFKSFTRFLKAKGDFNSRPVNICAFLIDIVKKVDGGYLVVKSSSKSFLTAPLATNLPKYLYARRNGYFNEFAPNYIVHDTWNRPAEELELKLKSYGHRSEEFADDQIIASFLSLWESLDRFNFKYLRNFHFGKASAWPQLEFIEADSILCLLEKLKKRKVPVSQLQLYFMNSRMAGRLHQYLIDPAKRILKV